MVRQLTETDFKEMMNLLTIDPIVNCYIISDLQNIGFGESYVTFHGLFKEDKLYSILMVYDTYGMVFSVDNVFDEAFIEIIDNAPIKTLSGQDRTIRTLHNHYSNYPINPMTLACLDKTNDCISHSHVRKINTNAELEQLYYLLKDIEEFNVKTQTKEEFIREKINLNLNGSIYAIYVENQIVASASVISETKTHAVINGVATHINHRKKGYANDLVDQIIYDYICKKNMGLILYYDNPNAQKIYKRKGFIDVNIWSSIKLYDKYSSNI